MQLGMNANNKDAEYLAAGSALDTLLLPRHRWYFIKEAFSPSIVDCAIEDTQCNKNDLIIDVFCGSGTVPLTAALQGYGALGFEVNPFLAFVSRTKLLQCSPHTIDKYLPEVINAATTGTPSPLATFSTFSEAGGAQKWLFSKGVLEAFEGGWKATVGIYPPIRDLLRLSLIGAAMDVCNAVKDGKCLRYRCGWQERSFGKQEFLDTFQKRVSEIKVDLERCPMRNLDASILVTDSRKLRSNELNGRKFRLCVMSPPYLNSFDYTDIYRPELFLGKFVSSNKGLKELRLKTLRSHVQVDWEKPEQMDMGQLFSSSLADIEKHADSLWNDRIPSMIQAYFQDLKLILSNLRELAQENASVWIVVSTSAYAGVEIPVDLIIADIGIQVGWLLRELKVTHYLRRVPGQQWETLYEKKNKQPHLRESIIIFDSKPQTKSTIISVQR